jgi:NADH:ubiquinone oxidoreductase subunit 4 (chain M)
MNGFPWLTVAGAVPLLGAIVIALIPGLPADSAEADRQARNTMAKVLALGFSLVTLVVVIIIAVKFQVGGPNYQFTEIYSGSRRSACTTRSAWTASRWCSSPCPWC